MSRQGSCPDFRGRDGGVCVSKNQYEGLDKVVFVYCFETLYLDLSGVSVD